MVGTTIVYGTDPLCGWCFGFGPALHETMARLGDDVGWEVACGGLVTGERVRPVALDAEYLRAGLVQVEAVTGVRAGSAFFDGLLADGTYVSDSEPPCRAVLIAQDLAGARPAIELSWALSTAYYVDGLRPDEADTIRRCAEQVGLDGDELLARWTSPEAASTTTARFASARAAGLSTYPSLFGRTAQGALTPLIEGIASADEIVATVDRWGASSVPTVSPDE